MEGGQSGTYIRLTRASSSLYSTAEEGHCDLAEIFSFVSSLYVLVTLTRGPDDALVCLRPGTDQSSKAAFDKSAFARTCFLLLKIRLVHINRAKSTNAFEHVLAHFSRKNFARCTCQNVFESTFAFVRLACASHIFNKRKQVRARFSKSAFAKSSFARLVCARP